MAETNIRLLEDVLARAKRRAVAEVVLEDESATEPFGWVWRKTGGAH
jgi:hypothetical protein